MSILKTITNSQGHFSEALNSEKENSDPEVDQLLAEVAGTSKRQPPPTESSNPPPLPSCDLPSCTNSIFWLDGYRAWHCARHNGPPGISLARRFIDLRDLAENPALAEEVLGGETTEPSDAKFIEQVKKENPEIIGVDLNRGIFWTENLIFDIENWGRI